MTRERWSVRKFKPEQILPEHMERILEAGRNAPSACNYQPQRVLVLQSDEAIATVRAITHWAFNAPTVLLVCADLAESWKNVDGADSAEVDATIALDHMMMEAYWRWLVSLCRGRIGAFRVLEARFGPRRAKTAAR
ncbi:MAG: nitroreductase family protein [Coriobacteriales bacterium]|nr:nitroreductase family protein [Coriobacteriales bacterium]